MMFDDNVGRLGSKTGAHIVDVRDIATGSSVPFDQALNHHVVRAEPYLAILQGNCEVETPTDKGTCSSKQNFFLSEILGTLVLEQHTSASSAPEP